MVRPGLIALPAVAIIVAAGCWNDGVTIATWRAGGTGGGATAGMVGAAGKAGSGGAGAGGSAVAGSGAGGSIAGAGAGGNAGRGGSANAGSGGSAGAAGTAARNGGTDGGGGTGGQSSGGAGAGASGAGATGAGGSVSAACPPCADAPRSLALPGAKHLVVDPVRKLLYVTMPASHPTYPNALLVIDPATVAVIASVPLATEPNVMGLAPDASRLWVGVDGAFTIRSVDLSSGTPVPGAQFVLPHATNTSTNQTVGALTFVAGSATSMMLTLFANREFDGLVVLDNGVPRGAPVYSSSVSRLAAGMGDTVFGFNDQSTGFEFTVFTLNAAGFTFTQYKNLVSDFNNDLIYSPSDQRVYAESGDVVNVADPAAPIRTPGFSTFGSMALLPASRALMLQGPPSGGGVSLLLLDTSLFISRSSAVWSSVTERTTWDLGVVGTDTVAFLATGDVTQNLPTRLIVVKTGVLQ